MGYNLTYNIGVLGLSNIFCGLVMEDRIYYICLYKHKIFQFKQIWVRKCYIVDGKYNYSLVIRNNIKKKEFNKKVAENKTIMTRK